MSDLLSKEKLTWFAMGEANDPNCGAAARTALELMEDKKKLQEALRLAEKTVPTFWDYANNVNKLDPQVPTHEERKQLAKVIADLKKEGLL